VLQGSEEQEQHACEFFSGVGRQVQQKERREEQYPAERRAQYTAERRASLEMRASLEIVIEILHVEKLPRHCQSQAQQEMEALVFWTEGFSVNL
jgi:hypothetical protein